MAATSLDVFDRTLQITNSWLAAGVVFAVLNRHLTPELFDKVHKALPEPVRALWPAPGEVPLGGARPTDRAFGQIATARETVRCE